MTEVSTPTYRSRLVSALSKTKIFSKLDAQALLKISEVCQVFTYHKKETVYQSGTQILGIYIIQTGLVNIYYRDDALRQNISASQGAGGCFGLMALTANKIAVTSSMALTTSKIIYIPADDFLGILKEYPSLMPAAFTVFAEQAHWLLNHCLCMHARTIEARLAMWLIQQPKSGRDDDEHPLPIVEIPTTKTNLALQLGVQIETLSRALANMREIGAIRIQGRRIAIVDAKLLNAYITTANKI